MSDLISNSELRIAGFGACMISGYPHDSGGFFATTCELIEKKVQRPVHSKVVALDGFPSPRAEKYLERRILGFNPHVVVIQFASTDAQCPLREQGRPSLSSGHSSSSPSLRSSSSKKDATVARQRQPATPLGSLRWEAASLIGYVRRIDPITPLPLHLGAFERMTDACKAAGAMPVVLSPFVYGSRYTMRNAVTYAAAMQELARQKHFVFVDCLRPLGTQPKSVILQQDGFHLSLKGHQIVGEAIAEAIIAYASEEVRARIIGDA